MSEDFTRLCKSREHYETPEWAAKAILEKEILTRHVVDPCAGTGILYKAAAAAGYKPIAYDIHLWDGFKDKTRHMDFFKLPAFPFVQTTVFMNPPFSLACEFVERSFELGARKILCFQRFAWWESAKRRSFWEKRPPARVYICGDRATCWRHHIPHEERERKGNTPTPHAWFVWEQGAPSGTLLSHVWRPTNEQDREGFR